MKKATSFLLIFSLVISGLCIARSAYAQWGWFADAWDTVTDWAADTWDTVTDVVYDTVDNVAGAAAGAAAGVISGVATLANAVTTGSISEVSTGPVGNADNSVAETLQNAANNIASYSDENFGTDYVSRETTYGGYKYVGLEIFGQPAGGYTQEITPPEEPTPPPPEEPTPPPPEKPTPPPPEEPTPPPPEEPTPPPPEKPTPPPPEEPTPPPPEEEWYPPNYPPNAALSCEIVDCRGPGCQCDGTWATFNGPSVIYRINNNSTDPDNNIVKSTWSIGGWQDPWFSCPPLSPDPLCDMGAMPIISARDYTIKLKVEDEGSLIATTSHPIRVKQDIIADFDCSLDGASWQNCEEISLVQDQVVYFRDQSEPSEGATDIIGWVWKKGDGETFQEFASNQPTASTTLTRDINTVRLIVTDNHPPDAYYPAGRSDSATQSLMVSLPLPEYREVPPIIWLKKIFASILEFLGIGS